MPGEARAPTAHGPTISGAPKAEARHAAATVIRVAHAQLAHPQPPRFPIDIDLNRTAKMPCVYDVSCHFADMGQLTAPTLEVASGGQVGAASRSAAQLLGALGLNINENEFARRLLVQKPLPSIANTLRPPTYVASGCTDRI